MSVGSDPMHPAPSGGAIMSSDESLAVIAYRMGEVEKHVTNLNQKFDSYANLYVNRADLALVLDPIRTKILEIEADCDHRLRQYEDNEKEKEKSKDNFTAQLKLAIIIAVISPIFSMILSVLVASKI